MRLTQLLFKPKRPIPGPGRYIKSGKRRVNIIYKIDVRNAKEDLKIEEQNMLYLRHPYLTFEQSFGHASALGKPKAFIAQKYLERQKIEPDFTLEDGFASLKIKDTWDC